MARSFNFGEDPRHCWADCCESGWGFSSYENPERFFGRDPLPLFQDGELSARASFSPENLECTSSQAQDPFVDPWEHVQYQTNNTCEVPSDHQQGGLSFLCDSDCSTDQFLPDQCSGGKRRSPNSDTESCNAVKKLKRGEHVRGKSAMQQQARDGQTHWARKIVVLRDEWEQRGAMHYRPFAKQRELCAELRAKKQRESVLLFLQLALMDGLIEAEPFPEDPAALPASLGWAGFRVRGGRAAEFRERMRGLLPAGAKESVLNNTLRRAGLAADSWDLAWRGLASFQRRPRPEAPPSAVPDQ